MQKKTFQLSSISQNSAGRNATLKVSPKNENCFSGVRQGDLGSKSF